MLKLSVNFYNVPIFSLRTGHQVGVALKPLLNPKNLKVEAWFAESKFDKGLLLLPSSEIREISRQGIAVNDKDAITPAEDLVRMDALIKLDFQLIGKKVYNEHRARIGKVTDYATDLESFFVQKFFVAPTVFRLFTRQQKVISRAQIVEITDKKIVVKDTDIKAPAFFKNSSPAPAPEA